MIKKKCTALSGWVEDHLRRIVAPLSPDARVIVILTMLSVFGALSIYMTVSSIYCFGRENGERMQIKHIERLELEHRQKADSINPINKFDYE